jgi:hypothetical protein
MGKNRKQINLKTITHILLENRIVFLGVFVQLCICLGGLLYYRHFIYRYFLFGIDNKIYIALIVFGLISALLYFPFKWAFFQLKKLELYSVFHRFKRIKTPVTAASANKVISIIFVLLILVIVSGAIFNVESIQKHQIVFVFPAIAFGALALWLNRGRINLKTESEKEEQDETWREKEFGGKFPRINRVPVVRWFVRWMYGEGWGYSTLVIIIFSAGLVLNILAANWSGGYTHFHSGESQFYVLIKSFSAGNYEAIYDRTQSIVIYMLGTIDRIFNGTLSIFSLRLIISLSTFLINFCILVNLRTIKILKLSKWSIIYVLIGFSFSYTIIFWSNVIRPDIILLTLFNLFLYEYLKNGTRNLLYLIVLSATAMSFKGSGFLLPVVLLTLVNFENIKPVFLRQHLKFGYFLYNNFFVIILTYLIFLLLSPTYLDAGLFSFFDAFTSGLEKFSTGHYGMFATGRSFISIYTERSISFVIFFSPIIIFYFVGTMLILYKNVKTFNLKSTLGSANIRVLLTILLSIVFFLFVFTKPIQFYRYYFPLLTVFIVVSFIVVAKIKPRVISLMIVAVFLIFNSYFIYHYELNNIRLQVNFSSYSPIYIDAGTRYWQLPPDINVAGKVNSIEQLPSGSYLLVTEDLKYRYDNILANPQFYTEGDLYELDHEELVREMQFYEQLRELTLVKSTGKDNKVFGYYLPYDVWYMTQPNYYIYEKD